VPFAPTADDQQKRVMQPPQTTERPEDRTQDEDSRQRGPGPRRRADSGAQRGKFRVLGDDAELTAAVLAAQDGDENAFRTVYRAVHPRLLGYVRTLVGDPDAEDVTSEAWLQIARDLDRFSGDADRFRGWAARIARNRALDHIRMRGRRPAIGGDETELTGKPADSDTAGEAIEALATGRTLSLIAQLPQDQAEAVVLRVVVGLDAKTAAETLGKRPGAVRTAAHRGLKRLAELLGVNPETDPESAGALSAVPLQREAHRRAVSSAGVTQVRSRTQKDM
jgi:RNA polymerase sigma-70 factor (ECF subfamily)